MMLEIAKLSASYGAIQALVDVTLSVREGEIVTVVGANGAGKTTLLRAISGLAGGCRGSIAFMGEQVLGRDGHEIVRLGISHVLAGHQVFGLMSVIENLRIGLYPLAHRVRSAEADSRLERVYAMFPVLRERLHQRAETLSGGEQQMLCIARCLVAEPKLLLLDEPSLGLAPKVVDVIFDGLRQLKQKGLTILLVEQNASLALDLADRAYVLETGHVARDGPAAVIKSDKAILAHYLGRG